MTELNWFTMSFMSWRCGTFYKNVHSMYAPTLNPSFKNQGTGGGNDAKYTVHKLRQKLFLTV